MKIIEPYISIFNKLISQKVQLSNNELSNNITDFICAKSKKIRPSLIFLTAKALDIEISEKIMHLALATEFIHNATLIHDDIIDNAETRRGKISLNALLGNNLSVLSGDLLLGYAIKELLECENNQVINIFAKSLIQICNGEINQHYSLNKLPDLEEYIIKSQNKTAELFYAALKSLCILENIKEIEKICNFAINFGIAFQLRDDLINILKTDNSKPILSDIYNGIYTLAVILYAQNKDIENMAKDELINEIVSSPQIIEQSQKTIEIYINKAIASLDFIKDNQYKNKIIELTKNLYKAE